MDTSKSLVDVSSPSETLSRPLVESDSPFSNLIYDVSQQVQVAMENMLKIINDVDQSSAGIMEELEKCKESASLKKQILDEEKERFQKAAYTVIDMLNNRVIS